MGWLRGPQDDVQGHRCPLPSLDKEKSTDYRRVHRWRWMCPDPDCRRVYRPLETETGLLVPPYEWVRLWPWSEWYWRRRHTIEPHLEWREEE